MCVCVCVCVRVCVCVCINIYYIYVYIYNRTHMYVYTYITHIIAARNEGYTVHGGGRLGSDYNLLQHLFFLFFWYYR